MSAHSPGPWRVIRRGLEVFEVASADHRHVCDLPNSDEVPGHVIANSLLIKAAPDLLAALKAIRPYLVGGEAIIANAAIAKAEGEPGMSFALIYRAQKEAK